MRGIHDYSVKELKKLHGEFKKLKTYKEKVDFVYSRFGKVYGHINQEVGGLDFTIKPKDGEENKARWMYFFNARKREIVDKQWEKISKGYDDSDNKLRFIEGWLKRVKEIYSSDSRDRGYGMAEREESIDSIEMNWELNDDKSGFMDHLIVGSAYFELEQRLLVMKRDIEDYSQVDESVKKIILNPRERFTLAHELKIIDLLLESPLLRSNHKRFAKVLSLLFGYELDGKDSETMYEVVRSYHGGIKDKGPVNNKNLESIWGKLALLGLPRPKTKT